MRTVFLLLTLAATASAAAQSNGDWTQWRGPNRDGSAPAFHEPKAWPAQLQKVWKVDVGIGYSNPIVVGDRVYLLTRRGGNEVVQALELATGKVIWHASYPAPFQMNSAATGHGEGPKSTPVASKGRLFTFGIGGVLSAWDLATGRRLWSKDFTKDFSDTWPDFGVAMSPIVDGNNVIAHVGGTKQGMLAAFDAATGAIKWKWSGNPPGYASPIIATLDGVRQLVTQSRDFIIGVDASNGTLLWKMKFETEYTQNIITPVLYKDTLIFSGTGKPLFAIRLKHSGANWTTEEVWSNPDVPLYMSTPVVVGDYLYGMSEKKKGFYFCVDARTGKLQWSSPGREGENAALIAAGNSILILNPSGELIVIRANPKAYEVVRKYQVADSATWSAPSLAGQRILIKDVSTVTLWKLE